MVASVGVANGDSQGSNEKEHTVSAVVHTTGTPGRQQAQWNHTHTAQQMLAATNRLTFFI